METNEPWADERLKQAFGSAELPPDPEFVARTMSRLTEAQAAQSRIATLRRGLRVATGIGLPAAVAAVVWALFPVLQAPSALGASIPDVTTWGFSALHLPLLVVLGLFPLSVVGLQFLEEF